MLLSFLVVVTPFGALIYYATNALVEQSAEGRVLAQQALEVTRRGQTLERLAEDITRSARQYQVVKKDEIKQRLEQFLSEYQQQLTVHSFLLEDPQSLQPIHELLDVFKHSHQSETGSLLNLTRKINQQVDQILDKRLHALNETAQHTQTQLSTLTLLLLAIEALLILFFSLSIIRPVNRITSRIQALGTGEEYQGDKVGGPDELVHLEQQLDWLTERLAEVEKEKQRFLRHMSHELKTPLTTLREGSDLLADQITGKLNSNQMEVVQLLQNNSRQLQTLIEQLLDYSRLSQNEPLTHQDTAITSVLQEAVEPFKLLLEQKQIKLSVPSTNARLLTDRTMLVRIVGNLISNAALYGSDNGQLTITIDDNNEQLCIDVINDGPVIPEHDIPHLFEPFYQGQNRRKGPVKGSGIGLSIVKDSAELIGASVALIQNASNRVGFRISLSREGFIQND
ncbi:HAMP domain-containing sensor histidine kinase [Neptuniibacter sp.]|uniref:HAMP domain-containing sensor histidine kinase n=1 Tax=Neptuniibacter sp. TaxID=1962643 RepID=UPI00260D9135|nr:HAMP domain-containing sensor histidine kinase [Neptuniibacter sp.]MCP4595041.1 HAMP domain-containing histidine kinase [Neptuniibacter sp.]